LAKRPGDDAEHAVASYTAGGGVDVFGFGLQELIIIMVIALVIFGGKKLPEVGSGLGKAIREFKRGTSEPDEIDVTPKETIEQKEPAEPAEKDRVNQDHSRTP
jgi:sec-independent protein translocase protein TatA